MAVYGATLFINSINGDYGFSETYFYNATTKTESFTLGEVLMEKRATVLTDQHKIVQSRFSNVAIFNDSKLSDQVNVVGLVGATYASQCDPWTCLNLRLESDWEHRGRKYLHGVLNSTFDETRVYDEGNAQNAAWQLFFTYLEENCLNKKVTAGVASYLPITSCVPIRETMRRVGLPIGVLRSRRTTAA